MKFVLFQIASPSRHKYFHNIQLDRISVSLGPWNFFTYENDCLLQCSACSAISLCSVWEQHSFITRKFVSVIISAVIIGNKCNISRLQENLITWGPLVLYRSPECWEYADLEQTWKYVGIQCCISFHPFRSTRKQIWRCHKNSKVNPRSSYENIGSTRVPDVIGLLVGSEEKDFWSFSQYMDMVMWPGTFEQIFIPHIPWRLHMKCGWPSGFWAKEV